MPSELIKQLLEAGVHFGHKTSRWNPKMKKFIFGERSGIYIIDLEKTEECLAKARDFLVELGSKGDYILFVGTKKQAQEVVKQEALRSGMYFVTERWPGGMLTNFATIKKSINRLHDIETMKEDGTFEKLTKKEVALLEKELAKLNKNFSGIAAMERMPKAIFIVDTKKEETAVLEATKLSIPIIGLIDTNSDPGKIAYPIPGNDDATKSIRVIATYIADSIMEGRKKFLSYLSQEGVAMKKEGAEGQPAGVLPDEEVEIKEIGEIIETTIETKKEEEKGGAKRPHPADKNKLPRKKA
ncbi:MAG: 30S ribosomal protein S2 [Deltaproteobacteria bacterium]